MFKVTITQNPGLASVLLGSPHPARTDDGWLVFK